MNINDIPEICHCGKKMHLTDNQKLMIMQFGANWPKHKKVIVLQYKSYKVPTYYIILHGLKGMDLTTGLGFPEWPESPQTSSSNGKP